MYEICIIHGAMVLMVVYVLRLKPSPLALIRPFHYTHPVLWAVENRFNLRFSTNPPFECLRCHPFHIAYPFFLGWSLVVF